MNFPGKDGAADEPEVPATWSYISLGWLLALVAAPILWATSYADVPLRIVLAGAAIWAITVWLKGPLATALNRVLPAEGLEVQRALAHGLLSALLELGGAGLYLCQLRDASMFRVLAFGAGAGCAEIVYVLIIGSVAKRDLEREAAWARAASVSLCVRYQVPIERTFALLGHIGSRGLIYVGLHAGSSIGPLVLIAAILLFAAVDGVAYYGHVRGWNWSDPAVCRETQAFFALVSLVEVTGFLLAFSLCSPGRLLIKV